MADDNLPPIPQQRSYPKMLASEKLINFIKDKEKFYAEPYSDYKQWSIGYGSYAGKLTGNPTIKSITKDGADKLLKEEIKKYEANVNKFNTFYNFTQNEFDAMVSFAYNLGSINQLTDNGKRSKEQIIQKMPEYNKAGGKVAGGLVTRRKEEVSIFKGEDTPKSYNDNNVAASSIRDQSEIDTIGNLLSDDQSNRERDGIRPTDGSSDYPILEERAEAVKGAVSEKAVSLVTSMFPDFTASNIISQFPESIRDLPQASRIASEIVQSIQTGQGVQTFTSAIEKISSAERGTARIQAIGSIATENEQLIKALVPSLEQIDFAEAVSFLEGFDEKSPKDRIVESIEIVDNPILDKSLDELIDSYKPANESEKKAIESAKSFLTPDQLGKSIKYYVRNPSEIPNLMDFLPVIGKLDNNLRDLLMSDDVEVQKQALSQLEENMFLGPSFKQYQVETLLTKSLEDIAQTSLVTEQIGSLPGRILTAERPREIETALTRFAGDIIYEESDEKIGRDTSKTLLAGGTEEEAKQMRQEIGGMALDSFIESNPTLAGIIEWFTENKELVTLLGTAGALAGLSGILGGGALGGFAAGAGGLAGVRMVLGKEGYEEFQGMIKEGAAPVFDFLGEALESSGLGEIPIIGDILKGTVGIGQENPLAATAALTGNFAMAAGLIAGEEGINVLEGESQVTDMIENLSKVFEVGNRNTQVTQDVAQQGDSPKPHLSTPMGSPDGQRATQQGSPVIGSASGLNPFKLTNNLIDYGRTGVGNISGVQ